MWRKELLTFKADKPTSIKDHEDGVINHAIINLLEDKFTLVESVHYLWALTQNNDGTPGNIYLGIENPLEHPEAFHEGIQKYLQKEKQKLDHTINEIKKISAETNMTQEKIIATIHKATIQTGLAGRGHPTLTMSFDKNGNSMPGKAYIAGELFFEKGNWYLTDRSGRFCHIQANESVATKEHLLNIVANQIEEKTHANNKLAIKPIVKVILDKGTPQNLWEKNYKKNIKEIGEVGIALVLIMKLFKRHIANFKNTIKATHTSEYQAIEATLNEMRFSNLASLVKYLNMSEFKKMVKEKLGKYNDNTENLENNLEKNIHFLELKAIDLINTNISVFSHHHESTHQKQNITNDSSNDKILMVPVCA